MPIEPAYFQATEQQESPRETTTGADWPVVVVVVVVVEHIMSSAGGGGGGGGSACAACKYQRRRCTAECPLAHYFPAERPRVFRNAHRLFGVSNILKTLAGAGPERHRDAMRAIVYEANAWDAYPAHGCLPIIAALEQQLAHTTLHLHHCNALIRAYRDALGPLPLHHHAAADDDPAMAYGVSNAAAAAAADPSTAYGVTNDAAAASSSSTWSLQAPPWTWPPQHDMTASNAVVADMAPFLPQLQHHQQR
ncbi:hypothetical protein ACP4OV_022709 [Aristida adscensionis]